MSQEFQVGEWVSINGERLEVTGKVTRVCYPLSRIVRYTLGWPEMKILLDVTELGMILFRLADIGDAYNGKEDFLLSGIFQLEQPSEASIGEVRLTYCLRGGTYYFTEEGVDRVRCPFPGLWRGIMISSPNAVVLLSPATPTIECPPPSLSLVS